MKDLHISRNLWLTIDEIAKLIGVPKYTLRYWESQFSDFLNPERTNGGHRRFTEDDMKRIKKIKELLKNKGYSIKGAQKRLKTEDHRLNTEDLDYLAQKIALVLKKEFLR